MHFTDLFIKKPVLAIVISLLILVLGLRSLDLLPVREYPFTENALITITTTYTGAAPETISGFITSPLERSIAQANGIDYMISSSTQGYSQIQAYLRLNYDPSKALIDINTKVGAVLNELPKEALQPTLDISIGDTLDSMYIGFYSDILPNNKITDYLIRVIQPKLQTVKNVQLAEIIGSQQFALRAWLDPSKMASFGVTADDVTTALASNDFLSAAGRTDGRMITVDLVADTGLHTVDEFRDLIIKSQNGVFVRLGDVATVSLGSETYDTSVHFDGKDSVYIGIKVAPGANVLTVIEDVKRVLPEIFEQLPEGLKGRIVYDATKFIESSIHEVEWSLVEAIIIVILVILLFLGTPRSVIIPVIAIPLSLVGTFFIMLFFGFSINLLTLLALVLAIGLVVDDAIIIVENVYRHLEKGTLPLEAALKGARELAGPIIAISVVLIAVYIPIAFIGGLTGALFTEFAFTLAGAVGISAVIALTLSPLMCARFLKNIHKYAFLEFMDHQFVRIQNHYYHTLKKSFKYLLVTSIFALIILLSNYFLYITSRSELAPQEDQGIIQVSLAASPNANIWQTKIYSQQLFDISNGFSEKDHIFQFDGWPNINNSWGGIVLKPWNKRTRSSDTLQDLIQEKISQIAGGNGVAYQPASLPGSDGGYPIQFVIGTTESFDRLYEISQAVMEKARATGMFAFLDSDLKIDKAQTLIHLDRDKAADLGLTMQQIGNILSSSLSNSYTNYFELEGRSYQVIAQVMRSTRINSDQLLNYYIKTETGSVIPLSTIATLKTKIVPESLNHFQQLNSATISGTPFPGVTLGEALETLKDIAKEIMPQNYFIDYGGQSRQYDQESNVLLITFFFSLLIIFLCLSALFESFKDPLIVLISVPMSICGAMIFISLGIGGASLNIYTEVGLVTLIGLISKHGILIVQFANDLQKKGNTKAEAVLMAATIRLRPILMTTAAMVLGVAPLLIATGAGAESRFNIGLVIASGISIGTLFTIFVVPTMYMILGKDLSKKCNRTS